MASVTPAKDSEAQFSSSDSDSDFEGPSLVSEPTPRTMRKRAAAVLRNGWCSYIRTSLRVLAIGQPGDRPWLNVLLLLVPFAFFSSGFGWPNGLTFAFALLAICPFAERLNFVTEDLSKYTNATIGGLLNASFGNVTEMVVSLMALKQGELWIIQSSMLGSILSNLLLVLGSAFLVGGCRRRPETGRGHEVMQKFNPLAANVNIGLLLLCVAAFSLPSVLVSDLVADASDDNSTSAEEWNADDFQSSASFYSAAAAVFLLFVYCLYLVFQLKTHRSLFDTDDDGSGDGGAVLGGRSHAEDDDEDDDPPVLGFWGAMFWLGVATVFISFLSDMLVDSFTGSADGIGVPPAFVWTILVPIVGNAAEHASAVIFAWKDNMSIAVSVAVGSAAQIGIFVVPLLVLVSTFVSTGDSLTFAFTPFAAGSQLLSVLLAGHLLQARRSHWLGGVFLIALYFVIAAGLWVAPDPNN